MPARDRRRNNYNKKKRYVGNATKDYSHSRLSHKQIKAILIQRFGLQCWGCDFKAPRDAYLAIDHIDPKSSGGRNTLDNYALLCQPCNTLKSNTLTLIGLRVENVKQGFATKEIHPIDIRTARQWCRTFLENRYDTTFP